MRTARALYEWLQKAAAQTGLTITSVNSGQAVAGVDLGSNKFMNISKPSVAMIVGQGVNATDGRW